MGISKIILPKVYFNIVMTIPVTIIPKSTSVLDIQSGNMNDLGSSTMGTT